MQDARARIISATLMRKSHYNDIAEYGRRRAYITIRHNFHFNSSPSMPTFQILIIIFVVSHNTIIGTLFTSAIEKLELIDARRFNTEL
jgi:hypothetical protein